MSQRKNFSLTAFIGNTIATIVALYGAGFLGGWLFEKLFGVDELGTFGEICLTMVGIILFFLIFIPLTDRKE